MRPNLFVVGAPKCGTTSLYAYLKSHPNIFFPDKKEPHHFNTDLPGNQWHPEWSSYVELYSNEAAASAIYRGDASVNYLYSNHAAANIAQRAPNSRIIICLRSIIPFVRSYHNQKLINLDEDERDLHEAWASSGHARVSLAREPRLLNYKAVGLFAEQIERFRKVFPDAQIRIITLEGLKERPREHYSALIEWLELPDDGRSNFEHTNPAVTHRWRSFARFLKYPPPYVKKIATPVKRMLGVETLGIARVLERANKAKGYGLDTLSPSLVNKISEHYSQDQERLTQHHDLWLLPKKIKT